MKEPEMVIVKLTEERKQALEKLCMEVIDLITRRTEGPMEAMMCLHFVHESFEDAMKANISTVAFSKSGEVH